MTRSWRALAEEADRQRSVAVARWLVAPEGTHGAVRAYAEQYTLAQIVLYCQARVADQSDSVFASHHLAIRLGKQAAEAREQSSRCEEEFGRLAYEAQAETYTAFARWCRSGAVP